MKRILFISLFLLFLLSHNAVAGKYTSLIATQAALISIEQDRAPPEPTPDTGASISTGKVIYNKQQQSSQRSVVAPKQSSLQTLQKQPPYNRQPSLFRRR